MWAKRVPSGCATDAKSSDDLINASEVTTHRQELFLKSSDDFLGVRTKPFLTPSQLENATNSKSQFVVRATPIALDEIWARCSTLLPRLKGRAKQGRTIEPCPDLLKLRVVATRGRQPLRRSTESARLTPAPMNEGPYGRLPQDGAGLR
jgi:hypothetical protein